MGGLLRSAEHPGARCHKSRMEQRTASRLSRRDFICWVATRGSYQPQLCAIIRPSRRLGISGRRSTIEPGGYSA